MLGRARRTVDESIDLPVRGPPRGRQGLVAAEWRHRDEQSSLLALRVLLYPAEHQRGERPSRRRRLARLVRSDHGGQFRCDRVQVRVRARQVA